MRLELLKGANGMCISLDSTRITEPKIYGILTQIMVWEVPDEQIRQILDEREPARNGWWMPDGADRLCSICGWKYAQEVRFMTEGQMKYCPNCGARMEGE